MPPWTLAAAGHVVFGRDAVSQLGDIVANHLGCRRALVVTDANLAAAGLVERAVGPLAAAGVVVGVFAGGRAEPPAEVVRAGVAVGREFAPDVVVGLGGGSNLDVAKLVALVLTHGGDVTGYAGENRVPGPTLPVVGVPTTAGTGSEVSPAAVFTDAERKMKVSCLSRHLRPAAAVIDPALTAGCPRRVAADAGIDALTHAVEALTAARWDEFAARPGGPSVYQGWTPVTDVYALEAVAVIGACLPDAVERPADYKAREGMAYAATLAGLAFSSAGVALTHAMEYPVGAAVHVSHGAGNGLLLPHVMRFNLPARDVAFGLIGRRLGAPDADHSTPAHAAVAEVEKLCRAVGIPERLRDLGVTRAMLPEFAAKAFGLKRLLRVNPREATEADILAVYEAAY